MSLEERRRVSVKDCVSSQQRGKRCAWVDGAYSRRARMELSCLRCPCYVALLQQYELRLAGGRFQAILELGIQGQSPHCRVVTLSSLLLPLSSHTFALLTPLPYHQVPL